MKRRIYKKWLKNPLNKRLVWKFCKPFQEIPPVAFVKEYDSACVIEQLSKFIDKQMQHEIDRLYIPKELLVPTNVGTSGIIASMRYGLPVIEHPERLYVVKLSDNEEKEE